MNKLLNIFLLGLLTISCNNKTSDVEMKKIEINNESLSYFDIGKGNTTLLFIHGAFINKEYWKEQLNYFSPNYRVVAIDLAGHGKSSSNREEWTVQSFGSDISKFIKELNLKNVILIGHSIGGDIMLETSNANNKNIIGLIGIDYFKNVGFELPENAVNDLITNLKNDFASTNEQYVTQQLVTSDTNTEITNRIVNDFKSMNPKVGIPFNKNIFGYSKREQELLNDLKLKLYLINVNYYPTNEENLEKYLGNNYEIYTLRGTSHYPMIENPKEFNSVLQKLITKITQTE